MGSQVARHGEQSSREEAAAAQAPATPHVLIFPFPVQGHITPMLKLAELLSLSGLRVTFLSTHHNQRRLLASPRVRARLARRPNLHLRSVPDGLSDDNPRDGDRLLEMIEGLEAAAPPFLRELLAGACAADGAPPPVTCVVADGLIVGFPVDVAEELGIPIIAFRTSSACSFWAYQRIPELLETGIIPFQDGCDLDELVACVPGMESFLRRRDLPSFCRANSADDPTMRFLKGMIWNATRYRGLVLNTPEFLELSALTQIRRLIPSTYPIGPLHGLLQTVEHLKGAAADGGGDGVPSSKHGLAPYQRESARFSRIKTNQEKFDSPDSHAGRTDSHRLSCESTRFIRIESDHREFDSHDSLDAANLASKYSTSLLQEDRACMEWLDARAPSSVVYVSFGSLALLKGEQLLELRHGLVNSGYHFLWAVRPGLVVDGGGLPEEELAEGTEERGLLVGWAPQQEVLAHPAVGCFLTHSGWNSTLESMWAGVPMVCLPYFADQLVNSRFVGEVWKNGVDIKDRCDRAAVERAVREVMAPGEIRAAAANLSEMVRECVGEGGSSYANLERLIRDITDMSLKRN